MKKVSTPASNAFCPQALYLYGTYREDGRANYGLFCWATYCYAEDFKFVACIGEDKLTRDLIRKNGAFSATILTEELLPAADFCGTHPGYETDKSLLLPAQPGAALAVPVPEKSVWTLELKVDQTFCPSSGSEIYICSIQNVMADERLVGEALSFEEKLALVRPVVTMNHQYLPVGLRSLGGWGSLKP